MSITKLWTGHLYGTNTGKVFLRLVGDDHALTAAIHVNDDDTGILVIEASGSFENGALLLSGHMPENPDQTLSLVAQLKQNGNLQGGWTTNFGPAGTIALYPDDVFGEPVDHGPPAQLYTARHTFGPIVIDRGELAAVAGEMQRVFPSSKLVVTVATDTEQIFYLDMLHGKHFAAQRANIVKFHVQEPDRDGLNRLISLEFGPMYNIAITQGTDEAWVIGRLEILKSLVDPYTRGYFTRMKSLGIGFNQIALVVALILLPSISSIRDRAVLMIGVIIIAIGVKWGQDRVFQNAVVYLGEKSPSTIQRMWPPILSLLIAILGGTAAAALAGLLEGWFK